jgi:Sec-independent protein translocase protein TatA
VSAAPARTIAAVDLFALLIVILIVAIIWRGPKTLPQIGAMFGRGVRDARREAEKLRSDEDARAAESDDRKTPGP